MVHLHTIQGSKIQNNDHQALRYLPLKKTTTIRKQQQQQVRLPSFRSFCEPLHQRSSMMTRNHSRTVSVPTQLPSDNNTPRLSLDILVDAIELEQSMYEAYRHERVKSLAREHRQSIRNNNYRYYHPYFRRRSHSAPGGITTMARSPQWRTPSSIAQEHGMTAQEIAESVVKKHIECARRK